MFIFSEKLTDGVEGKTEVKEKTSVNMPNSSENTLGDAEVFHVTFDLFYLFLRTRKFKFILYEPYLSCF